MVDVKPRTPKILVLDLDSTLVHTSGNMQDYEKLRIYDVNDSTNADLRSRTYSFELTDVIDTPGTGSTTPMWGIYRPHYREFLTFAFSYFDEVRVWSAGQFKYVYAITDKVFSGLQQPVSVKTYDDCKKTVNRIYKPLVDYFASTVQIPSNYPPTCTPFAGCDMSNMLILDDRSDTFELNPQNGVEIPVYEPDPNPSVIRRDDIALLQFMAWLSLPEVANAPSLCKLDKSRIFTTSLSEYSRRLNQKQIVPYVPKTSELNPVYLSNASLVDLASFSKVQSIIPVYA